MIDPKLVAVYKRLAGRRGMNQRNADRDANIYDHCTDVDRRDCYKKAINQLCDAFQTTEDELTKATEVT